MKNTNLNSLITTAAAWPTELFAMDTLNLPARPETLLTHSILALNPNYDFGKLDDEYALVPFDAASYTGLPELLPAGATDVVTIDMGADKNYTARWWLGIGGGTDEGPITGSRASLIDIFNAFYGLKCKFIADCDGFVSDIYEANEFYELLLAAG